MENETSKQILNTTFIIFGIFLVGAVIFYLMNIGVLPDFRNDIVDEDGHYKELAIPENLRKDIDALENSIEELVKSGQVGQEVEIKSEILNLLEEQNQFVDDITRIEDRFEDLPPPTDGGQISQEEINTLEQLELRDRIDGPNGALDFNPL